MSLRVFDLKSCGRHRLWNRSEPLPSEGRTFHGNENGEKLEVLNLIPEMWSLSWRRKIGHGVVRQKIEGTNEEWKRRAVPLLDPKWGLERMVLTLSGSKL